MNRSWLVPLLLAACAKTPIGSAGGSQDAALPKDLGSGTAAELRPATTEVPPPVDAMSCVQTTAEACPGPMCDFPLDWATAQQPEAWCRPDGQPGPAGISLCRTVEGYDRVWTYYDMGGEFFLYDPVTGAFVQRRSDAKALYTCVLGVPGGPATATPICAGPESVFPLVCPAPRADAGPPVEDGGADGGVPTTLPTCAWPAIDQGDASPGQCRSNRTLLACVLKDGSNEICASSNPESCPDQSPATTESCIVRCAADEYAVTCGSPDPAAPAFAPPEGLACHALAYTPGGVVFYCCPCP